MWHTWFLLHSLVYVAKFVVKMCLLFKTPADRKTSSSASLGKTNGPFCPKDEIWGPSRSRGSEKKTLYHTAFMSLKSRVSISAWSPGKSCWWDLPGMQRNKHPKRRCHGNQEEVSGREKNPVHSQSVWRDFPNLFVREHNLRFKMNFLGQIPTLKAILSALKFLNWIPIHEQSSVLKPLSCHLILHCCLPWTFQL